MVRGVALICICVALAVTAVVLVSGEATQSTFENTQTTGEVTQSTGQDARSRTLSRLAAEDLVRNFRDHGNRNVRGTHVRCRDGDKGQWLCTYVVDGKTCAAAVSGTPDDPETTLFCDSEGNES